jgi:hypothetical protein
MSLSGFAQNSGKTFEKVKLKKANVVQDSMLSTFPLLVSIDEVETNLSGTGKAKKSFKDNSVSLYPVPGKGVIYIKLDKLPKDYKPILEFYNSGGSVIKNIYVKSKISTINLAKIPAGTYTVSIDLNEERYSWEIEKE